MPRPKEYLKIRKLAGELPALVLLRDLIGEALTRVTARGAEMTPEQKIAHYEVLTGFQTRVDAEIAKKENPGQQPKPAMPPLL